MRIAAVIAVVLALAIGGVLAYNSHRSVEEQKTANCIAAAEAREPVGVAQADSAGLAFGGPTQLNIADRRAAVEACGD